MHTMSYPFQSHSLNMIPAFEIDIKEANKESEDEQESNPRMLL